MYGLDAISAANGWAMAIAGALIVMTGLTVLSFVISQLHKVAGLLEKGLEKESTDQEKTMADLPKPPPDQHPVFDIDGNVYKIMKFAFSFTESCF